MSSISASHSPLQLLQNQLQSSISSGAIASSDQDALSSALTDIDSSLQDSQSADTKNAPGDLKSKIDDLIASEVSSGKLTSDQATELKSVFADTFSKGGAGGAGGPGGTGGLHGGHGPHGAGGPPPSASTDDNSDDSDDTTGTSAADLLQQFLQSLQASLSNPSTSTYSSSGSTSTASAFSALLIDYKT